MKNRRVCNGQIDRIETDQCRSTIQYRSERHELCPMVVKLAEIRSSRTHELGDHNTVRINAPRRHPRIELEREALGPEFDDDSLVWSRQAGRVAGAGSLPIEQVPAGPVPNFF